MLGQLLKRAATEARNWWDLVIRKIGLEALWIKQMAIRLLAKTPQEITANEASTTKIESLRRALEADDYATLAGIIRYLDWERDAEARHELAEWIESGELVFIQENGINKLRRRGYSTSAACFARWRRDNAKADPRSADDFLPAGGPPPSGRPPPAWTRRERLRPMCLAGERTRT